MIVKFSIFGYSSSKAARLAQRRRDEEPLNIRYEVFGATQRLTIFGDQFTYHGFGMDSMEEGVAFANQRAAPLWTYYTGNDKSQPEAEGFDPVSETYWLVKGHQEFAPPTKKWVKLAQTKLQQHLAAMRKDC